ncbi:MAG: lactate racemase domain-containing protein [Planctomycetota bacterium]
MSASNQPALDFSASLAAIRSEQVLQYERSGRETVTDLAHATYLALQKPLDFPPMDAAIVPDDRVGLAIDPNAPGLAEIVRGILRAVSETAAHDTAVVLWDEASDQTMADVQHEVGEQTRVVRHESSDRASLRYMGADQDADPVYLNRRLVDADFVLPVAVGRPQDTRVAHDLTGIFPFFADSASRDRHRRGSFGEKHSIEESQKHANEPSWWLGVQMMLCVIMNDHGHVCDVVAGTPEAIGKRIAPGRTDDSEFPPSASMVVASLDGGAQQQTWTNAARALAAATRYTQPGGTIVLWTDIQETPGGFLLALGDDQPVDFDAMPIVRTDEENEFPDWDATNGIAKVIQRVAADHRVLIHSGLSDEAIESIGLAAIGSEEELSRLTADFPACGILRAAQFAGRTIEV